MTVSPLDRLLAEIDEQPSVVARLIAEQGERAGQVAAAMRAREAATIVLLARGSSDNAATLGRYLFEVRNERLTSLAAPSGLTLYGRGPRLDQAIVIGVSQSGQSEDIVTYVRHARRQGALTVAIVNDQSSPLAQAAEWVLDCLAGPELSVPATKTVTAQMTLLAMLSSALDSAETVEASLAALPEALSAALALRPAAAQLARHLVETPLAAVIGRGFAYPVALEIALKLKETSYTAAEPFSAADFLHGPIALADEQFGALVVDVGGRSSSAARDIIHAVRERGGQAVVVQAGEVEPVAGCHGLCLPTRVHEPLAPLLALVLGQLLAIEIALAQGIDPARPRGIRKVTSTR